MRKDIEAMADMQCSDERNAPLQGARDHLLVAIVIASVGRPDMLEQMIECLSQQSESADFIVLSVTSAVDLPQGFQDSAEIRTIIGDKGSCCQRNRAIDLVQPHCDIVMFYDDDFIPSINSIKNLRRFFEDNPHISGATGNVLADGANNSGISSELGKEIVRKHDEKIVYDGKIIAYVDGLYGCNMACRAGDIGSNRFDERLPLYGWQEDIDFSASLRASGKLAKTAAFAGVHQGVKHGRTSGVRFGYSQIINPLYLARKGTIRKRVALNLVIRNLLINHARSIRPEPWVDRRGRVAGNWIGLIDAIRGRVTPERILTL